MDFSDALRQLKDGKLVTRTGWNGNRPRGTLNSDVNVLHWTYRTPMFIYLVPGSTFKVNRAPLNVIFPEGTDVEYLPHVDMRTRTGECVPWLASQTDLLAADWEIVNVIRRDEHGDPTNFNFKHDIKGAPA